jgi:hypothetical protein
MKRIIRTFGIIAMVALVATSCKKKEEETIFNMTIGETYGFEAGPSFDGSKAYFDPNDGFTFKWNQGDPVMVFNLDDDYTKSEVGMYTANTAAHSSAFSPVSNEVGSPKNIGYRVFYNAGNVLNDGGIIHEDNRVAFRVNPTQTYEPSCWADPNAMVMACTAPVYQSHIGSFVMEHIFGYLNVAIANNSGTEKKVKEIEVTDSEWNLYGELSLKLGPVVASQFTTLMNECVNNNDAYLSDLTAYLQTLGYNASGAGKKIKMNFKNDSFNLTPGQWEYFFISLRPGALYRGFTVKITFSDNSYFQKYFAPNMDYIIKPAIIRNVYAVTKNNGSWYINNEWVNSDPN